MPRIEPGTSGSVARNFAHYTAEAIIFEVLCTNLLIQLAHFIGFMYIANLNISFEHRSKQKIYIVKQFVQEQT
jgi:hypothetical protein